MIYFDNNATTQVLDEVREAMQPFLSDQYGNPSSAHALGTKARVAVDRARKQIATCLGVTSSEIVITGCGSEANNQAIIGTLLRHLGKEGKNLVVSAIEHPAVLATAKWAAKTFGFECRIAPIRIKENTVDPQPFLERFDQNTVLVSVMAANNETGILLPLKDIFKGARAVGAICHTDSVQGIGKIGIKPSNVGADLLSFSAHKFHGPKGIGGLYVRRGVKLESLLHGGSQENGRRAGTEAVANLVGMGCAAEIARDTDVEMIRALRDDFEQRLLELYGDQVQINFKDLPRTPNASSVQFKGQDGNLLLIKLDRKGFCVSTGAACSSGSLSPSKGLMAMGLKEREAAATLRISFSKLNTQAEVDSLLEALPNIFPIRP